MQPAAPPACARLACSACGWPPTPWPPPLTLRPQRRLLARDSPTVGDATCGLSVEHRQTQLPQARRIIAKLRDRCFNCLSYSHHVATCRLPRRCLRCHGFRHLARECK
ncbi:hypothetical protein C2845_PM11G04000 [Panicum miliaceum]|uniref:CCHC-type domain-containing protein n=1 Tax=Panicum miliaceum TaxID=4540 RepID=A0A3L6RS51_PANMI|nr:hypothetical protein C2845_PM11G04000 [Panicum miliaceum]